MTLQTIFIYGVFFFAFLGGLMFALGIPKYVTVGTEMLIYLLLIVSLITRIGRGISLPNLWYSFFCMVLISIFSTVINGTDIVRAIFSLRLLYRFYFFYLAITILRLDDNSMKRINAVVAILLLFQLPVVVIKLFIYGISERTQGTYAIHDGSLSTMIPIIVIFYLAGYYYLYRPKLVFILTGIGFIFYSIAGAKRAVFFLYPIQFFAIYYYIYIKGKGARLSKKIGTLFLLLILIPILLGSILYFNKTLNPEGKIGGSIDLGYAVDYALKYTTREDELGYSHGRVATTIRIAEAVANSGLLNLFFGLGPGITIPSRFDSAGRLETGNRAFEKYMIGYGKTSMSKILFEFGLMGVVAYSFIVVSFIRMCLAYYKYEKDPYWKAYAAGSVGFAFSIMFFSFTYHWTALWGDTLPCLYFYAMAIVCTRSQRIRVHTFEAERLT